jgi:transcriptional regulator of arginine metabolism
MASELNQPALRRTAILRILRESPVRKQNELVRLLKRAGFDATQSSVSRDLRELGVAKAGDRYLIPTTEDSLPADRFAAIAAFVREVRSAGPSWTVVRTTTGTAQSVAVAIDRANWPEVAGTISGDDTIFIATADAGDQRELLARLHLIFRI